MLSLFLWVLACGVVAQDSQKSAPLVLWTTCLGELIGVFDTSRPLMLNPEMDPYGNPNAPGTMQLTCQPNGQFSGTKSQSGGTGYFYNISSGLCWGIMGIITCNVDGPTFDTRVPGTVIPPNYQNTHPVNETTQYPGGDMGCYNYGSSCLAIGSNVGYVADPQTCAQRCETSYIGWLYPSSCLCLNQRPAPNCTPLERTCTNPQQVCFGTPECKVEVYVSAQLPTTNSNSTSPATSSPTTVPSPFMPNTTDAQPTNLAEREVAASLGCFLYTWGDGNCLNNKQNMGWLGVGSVAACAQECRGAEPQGYVAIGFLYSGSCLCLSNYPTCEKLGPHCNSTVTDPSYACHGNQWCLVDAYDIETLLGENDNSSLADNSSLTLGAIESVTTANGPQKTTDTTSFFTLVIILPLAIVAVLILFAAFCLRKRRNDYLNRHHKMKEDVEEREENETQGDGEIAPTDLTSASAHPHPPPSASAPPSSTSETEAPITTPTTSEAEVSV